MMKVLYFIVSHANPDQVVRLVSTLKQGSPSCSVVIHHDYSKSYLDPNAFAAIANVKILSDYVEIEWGDFSLTRAILRSFDWALAHLEFDWLVLLSGQDYPIKPLTTIEAYLGDCGYDALLRGFLAKQPNPWPDGEAVHRYFYRYYKLPRFKYSYRIPSALKDWLGRAREGFNRKQRLMQIRTGPRGIPLRIGFSFFRSPFDDWFQCYGGPTWFDASRRCIEYIRDFVAANGSYVAWDERTFLADESFMATILLNQPKFNVLLDNKRYVQWNPADPAAGSPRVIRSSDLDRVLKSEAHFARKFDLKLDSRVLDMIDERIGIRTEATGSKTCGEFPALDGSSGIGRPLGTH